MSLPFALLLGAIGSATAPASSLMTIRQYRAKGDFVNTLIQVVAMDDAVALLAFSACAAIAAGTESTAGFSVQSALKPLVLSLAMMLGAYLLGRALCALLRGRSSDHRLVLTCSAVFLIAAVCASMDVSPLLGCMVLGATYANVTGDKDLFKQVNRVTPQSIARSISSRVLFTPEKRMVSGATPCFMQISSSPGLQTSSVPTRLRMAGMRNGFALIE